MLPPTSSLDISVHDAQYPYSEPEQGAIILSPHSINSYHYHGPFYESGLSFEALNRRSCAEDLDSHRRVILLSNEYSSLPSESDREFLISQYPRCVEREEGVDKQQISTVSSVNSKDDTADSSSCELDEGNNSEGQYSPPLVERNSSQMVCNELGLPLSPLQCDRNASSEPNKVKGLHRSRTKLSNRALSVLSSNFRNNNEGSSIIEEPALSGSHRKPFGSVWRASSSSPARQIGAWLGRRNNKSSLNCEKDVNEKDAACENLENVPAKNENMKKMKKFKRPKRSDGSYGSTNRNRTFESECVDELYGDDKAFQIRDCRNDKVGSRREVKSWYDGQLSKLMQGIHGNKSELDHDASRQTKNRARSKTNSKGKNESLNVSDCIKTVKSDCGLAEKCHGGLGDFSDMTDADGNFCKSYFLSSRTGDDNHENISSVIQNKDKPRSPISHKRNGFHQTKNVEHSPSPSPIFFSTSSEMSPLDATHTFGSDHMNNNKETNPDGESEYGASLSFRHQSFVNQGGLSLISPESATSLSPRIQDVTINDSLPPSGFQSIKTSKLPVGTTDHQYRKFKAGTSRQLNFSRFAVTPPLAQLQKTSSELKKAVNLAFIDNISSIYSDNIFDSGFSRPRLALGPKRNGRAHLSSACVTR